jgi:hypothetical protein
MYAAHQRGDVVRGRFRDDPMAKIEDKARFGSRGPEDRIGLAFDGCKRC